MEPKGALKQPLKGQVALVTGAGVRLGRALALALGQQGCDILVHHWRSRRAAAELAQELRALSVRAKLLTADLSNGPQALKLARQADRAFGRVDILINNAAIFHPTALEDLTERELDRFLSVNLKAPYILSAELGRRMKKRGRGIIINVACLSAFRPWAQYVPYSISKAGLVALTVGLAKLLAPQVRVNAIAPGTVLPRADLPPEAVAAEARRVPLKKIGAPDDIVAAALYLLGAPFVTGQVLAVDGGRSIV